MDPLEFDEEIVEPIAGLPEDGSIGSLPGDDGFVPIMEGSATLTLSPASNDAPSPNPYVSPPQGEISPNACYPVLDTLFETTGLRIIMAYVITRY